MSAPNILGVDPGNGAIKLWCATGGRQLPAIVATDGQRALGRAVGLATVKAPLHIQTPAGAFYLGLGAHDWGRPVENMDHERFTGTPEMRALVYGALSGWLRHDALPAPAVALTLGLPVETLSGAEDAVKATVASVRRWLEGAHTWAADEQPYTLTVTNVAVTSQPVGALFDYLLDTDGQFVTTRKAAFRQEIGVISIGMNTVELLVVRGGQVVPGDTYGDRRGVRRLLELCNPEGLYTLGELDGQLRAGRLDTSAALPIWQAEVSGFIERRWAAKWRRFATVILVGGGVQLLPGLAARFGGKAYQPDEPVLATARGLYKIGLSTARRGR